MDDKMFYIVEGKYCSLIEHNYCCKTKPDQEENKLPGLLCSYCRNEVTDQASFMKTRMDIDVQPLILCKDCHVAKFLCGNNKRKDEGRKKNDRSYKRSMKNNEGKSQKKRTEMNGESFTTKISWDEDIFVSPKEEAIVESVVVPKDGVVVAAKDFRSRECFWSVAKPVVEVGRECPNGSGPGEYFIVRHKKYYMMELGTDLSGVRMSCHPNCRFRLESEGGLSAANLVATCGIKEGDEVVLPFSAEMSQGGCVHCGGSCKKNGVKKGDGGLLNREERKIQTYLECFEQMEIKAGSKAKRTPKRSRQNATPRPVYNCSIRGRLVALSEATSWVEREDVTTAASALVLLRSVMSSMVRVTPSTESVGQCFSDISDDNSSLLNNNHDFASQKELPDS